MSKLNLSVFIIAKNEGDRIANTIKSVREYANEVIVIDSGSSDDTVSVSESLGARVIFNSWEGYVQQKSFGEQQCTNDWVLNLDADEEVSAELMLEIIQLFSQGTPEHSAYALPSLPIYPYQKRTYRWMIHNSPIRLYNKKLAYYHDDTTHDFVKIREGTGGTLRGFVLHRSFRSLAHHVEKMNFYSDAQAENRFNKKRYIPTVALLILPIIAFIKCYIFRRSFLLGIDGIVLSHMHAFHRFLILAKTRELYLKEKSNEEKG